MMRRANTPVGPQFGHQESSHGRHGNNDREDRQQLEAFEPRDAL